MSNNDQNQQNGRRPPAQPDQKWPQQTGHPSDPRIGPSTSAQPDRDCRDYVWGICKKGASCRYRHVLNIDSMKKIIKFCHNFQNKRGCRSPHCTYLHSTNEEEVLFLSTGQIPRVLRDRYAAMAAANPANMYPNEFLYQQPPLPPPPIQVQPIGVPQPPPHSGAVQPVTVLQPPPHATGIQPVGVLQQQPHSSTLQAASVPQPPLPAPLLSLLAPPPPPLPPTEASTPVQITPPVFTAPATYATNVVVPPSQPPLPILIFDASRPPPPLPSTSAAPQNSAVKRLAGLIQAGPSKARKLDNSNVVENSHCESCAHRKFRLLALDEQLQTLERKKEYQSRILEMKTELIDKSKLVLKSALSPHIYQMLDDYIENTYSENLIHKRAPNTK